MPSHGFIRRLRRMIEVDLSEHLLWMDREFSHPPHKRCANKNHLDKVVWDICLPHGVCPLKVFARTYSCVADWANDNTLQSEIKQWLQPLSGVVMTLAHQKIRIPQREYGNDFAWKTFNATWLMRTVSCKRSNWVQLEMTRVYQWPLLPFGGPPFASKTGGFWWVWTVGSCLTCLEMFGSWTQ